MENYPIKYIKENFINLLKKKDIEDSIIERYYNLPESISFDDVSYKLNIIVTDNVDEKLQIFEINYYSDESMSFLFEYKTSSDTTQIIVDLDALLNQTSIIKLDLIDKEQL